MRLYLLFLSWLSVVLFALPAEAARLLLWRFDPNQNQLLFTTDVGVQPTAQLISNPTRLVIDLPGIQLGRPTVNQSYSGAIRNIRIGQLDARTTRIVVELAPGYTMNPDGIQFRGSSPTNWSVSLPTPERVGAQSRPTPPAPGASLPSLPPLPERPNATPVANNAIATIDAIQLQNNRRLEVRADRTITVSSRWNERAGLYEITIPGARLAERLQGPQLKADSPISELRVRQQDAQTVVLLLQPTSPFRLGPIDQRGSTVNFNLEQATSLAVPTEPGNSPARPIVVPEPNQRPAPPSSLPSVPNSRLRIVIDPGHGGQDSGAIGLGGLKEKDVVLDVSQQVARLLEQQGVTTLMTRDDDRFISLQGRTEMANRTRADLFVSIHANAVDNRPDVSGLETYYFSSGLRLASTIHRNILDTVEIRDRSVRQARFYVLRNSAMPSVLVEIGFVTGVEDSANLRSPDHRRQLASAIARGILEYVQRNLR